MSVSRTGQGMPKLHFGGGMALVLLGGDTKGSA